MSQLKLHLNSRHAWFCHDFVTPILYNDDKHDHAIDTGRYFGKGVDDETFCFVALFRMVNSDGDDRRMQQSKQRLKHAADSARIYHDDRREPLDR